MHADERGEIGVLMRVYAGFIIIIILYILITEDMIKSELLNYSELEKESSVTLIDQDAEIFCMQNFQPTSDQLLSILTVADLEALIVKIVQKALKEEMQKLKHEHLPEKTTQMNHLLKVIV